MNTLLRLFPKKHNFVSKTKNHFFSVTRCITSDSSRCSIAVEEFLNQSLPTPGIVSQREIQSHYQEVQGSRMHYERSGTGRHVVLLLPGLLGSTRRDFGYQLETLNKDMFTVVCLDPLGYGKSQPPARSFTLDYHKTDADAAASLMQEFLDEQNLDSSSYSVVGINDGGVSAILMAAAHPTRIKKLVTIGTGAKITQSDTEAYSKIADLSSWAPRAKSELSNLYDQSYLSSTVQQWLEIQDKLREQRDGDLCTAECGAIQCPSLIVHGMQDPVVDSEHAQSLHKLMQNSRVHLFPEGKHYVQTRFFKEFNSILEQFLIE